MSALAPRVLVVDDEPAIRDLLVRALGMAGYDVVAVGWGSGLIAARNAELPYDLVVTNRTLTPWGAGCPPREERA